VRPYALIKTRLLNASHSALGYLGVLAGLERADEAMADPVLRRVRRADDGRRDRAAAARVVGLDLAEYQRTVLDRLANPEDRRPAPRLCRNGSRRCPATCCRRSSTARAAGSSTRCSRPRSRRGAATCAASTSRPPDRRRRSAADRLRLLATWRRATPARCSRAVAVRPARDDDGFVAELTAALDLWSAAGARAALEAALAARGRSPRDARAALRRRRLPVPLEEPAFVASADVTNRLLAELGVDRRFDPEELQAFAVGKNFRATALELAAAHGRLDQGGSEWVDEERSAR
jgi:fructuronate reductase/mannitol 2-dehydrogenase